MSSYASLVNGLTNMQYQSAITQLQQTRAFTEDELRRWQREIAEFSYPIFQVTEARKVQPVKQCSFKEKLLDKYGTKEDV